MLLVICSQKKMLFFVLIIFDSLFYMLNSPCSIYLQWHHQSLQVPNTLDIAAFLSIFTKFLGTPWCALSKKLLSLTLSFTGLSNKLEVHYFFNTSSSCQDWTKLHYYVLQCKNTAWTIPAVSYTHFFKEQGSLFLQYHHHQLPVSFFHHYCSRKANCDIKYGLSTCLSLG